MAWIAGEEPSAAALVAELHGQVLRLLSDRLGIHCQGLAQAARRARACGMLSNQAAQRVTRLDVAHNVVRHVTGPRTKTFLAEIRDEVGQHRRREFLLGDQMGVVPDAPAHQCSGLELDCGVQSEASFLAVASGGKPTVEWFAMDNSDIDSEVADINYFPDARFPSRRSSTAAFRARSDCSPERASAASSRGSRSSTPAARFGPRTLSPPPSPKSSSPRGVVDDPAELQANEGASLAAGVRADDDKDEIIPLENIPDLMMSFLDKLSKTLRGALHAEMRNVDPEELRDWYVGLYVQNVTKAATKLPPYVSGIPEELFERVRARAFQAVAFLTMKERGNPACTGKGGAGDPVRPQRGPSASNRPGSLHTAPGFGMGPKRSRRKR
uniref:Uncharacterized protein n=1 Tax=Zooxanthella nutricula TaxID=1333877 RepID=A0A7S2LNF6_9DINO